MVTASKLSNKEEKDLITKINGFISEGTMHCETKHSRCEENSRYVRGEQWSAGDILRQAMRERPSLSINSTFKVVSAIANRETVERLVPKVFGRSERDNGIASILDESTRWQRQVAMSEHYESRAFWAATVGGYGAMHKYWSPVLLGGDGMISDEDVPIWEMLWPSRARETNISDRRWHVRGKWMDQDQIDGMWGHRNKKLRSKIKEWGSKKVNIFPDTNTDMGKNNGMTGWGWSSIKRGQWINSATKEAFVIEAEWKELETYYRAAIPTKFVEWVGLVMDGQPLIMDGPPDEYGTPQQVQLTYEDYMMLPLEQQESLRNAIMADTEIAKYDSLKELDEFKLIYERVFSAEFEDWAEKSREIVRYAIMCDGVIIDHGERPWGYSYYFITGFPFEQSDGMDFFGAVDIIKGPQDFKNAFLSNALAMYMSSPKAPILVEEDAAPNIQQIVDKVASPAAVVTVPKGFVGMENQKWKILQSPNFPPMMDYLLQVAESGVEQSLGLSSIDINSQGDLRRISGTVVSAAKTASNVIVAGLFDSLRKFRKEYALCNMKFITRMYTPKEIIRIVGEEKLEDMPHGLPDTWSDVIKMDVMIDEQPSSPSEQMEVMGFMTNTGFLNDMWKSGALTTEDVLDFIPMIPESRKRKILKNKRISEMYAQINEEYQKQQILMNGLVSIVQEAGGDQIIQQFQELVSQVEAEAQQGMPGAPTQPSGGEPPIQ